MIVLQPQNLALKMQKIHTISGTECNPEPLTLLAHYKHFQGTQYRRAHPILSQADLTKDDKCATFAQIINPQKHHTSNLLPNTFFLGGGGTTL